MTKQLYEEALADVKKLKEVAEDNAKRALLEAVTPRIRDLIENQLLGETAEDEVVDSDKLLMDELPGGAAEEDFVPPPVAPEEKLTLDLDSLHAGGNTYELTHEAASTLGSLLSTKRDVVKFESSIVRLVGSVKRLSESSDVIKESKSYHEVVETLIEKSEALYTELQESFGDISSKKRLEKMLENCYSTLKKLTEQKMNRNKYKSLNEGDVTLKLTGMPDDLDLDSIGVDLITGGEEGEEGGDEDLDLGGDEVGGDEGGEDLDLGDLGGDEGGEDSDESDDSEEKKMESRRLSDNTIVEIDEGMLRREIARMKALREADETKAQSWGNGPGDVSDEFEDDDMGDPFVDIELTTEADDDKKDEAKKDDLDEMDEAVDEMDELDEKHDDLGEYGMEEVDEMEEAEDVRQMGGNVAQDSTGPGAATQKQSRQPGHTVESLRRRLAAEYRLQTEAKKKAQKAKKGQQVAEKQSKDAKTQVTKANKKLQAKKLKEAYNYFATKFNESVTRSNKLRGMLAEASSRNGRVLNGESSRSAAEAENLRTKLAEANLFNAKLLFTNKLLQNESLTRRQKAEVIERLDEARTEREVKLVYESVTKSLASAAPRNLTESASPSVIGSSSRPTRSAATNLNEGFEADRWARLAGIVK